VGDVSAYRRGRDVASSLGLVPRQHSSGGRARLLGISKRGDRYLRSLLVHGARSVDSRAAGKRDRLSDWINRLRERRGFNRTVVALANKLARIGWAVLAHNTADQTWFWLRRQRQRLRMPCRYPLLGSTALIEP
jgi:transposase